MSVDYVMVRLVQANVLYDADPVRMIRFVQFLYEESHRDYTNILSWKHQEPLKKFVISYSKGKFCGRHFHDALNNCRPETTDGSLKKT